MKLYLALALSGLLACGASKTSTLPQKVVSVSTIAESEIDVREVAADSFVLTDRAFYDSNVLVVRMPDGTVVFCSSSFETVGTSHMIAWARRALQPTKMIAINTHFHFDGSGGNEAYRNAGVTTYSTNLTKALLLERGPGMQKRTSVELGGLKGRRVGAMTLIPADNTFDEQTGLTLTFGAEQVRIVYPGPGHSVDNLIVHFPARKLLFGGCMIRAQRSIGYTGDANLEHWSHAVETAQALAPQIVVPGHGQVGGAELFAVTLDAISDTKKK